MIYITRSRTVGRIERTHPTTYNIVDYSYWVWCKEPEYQLLQESQARNQTPGSAVSACATALIKAIPSLTRTDLARLNDDEILYFKVVNP